MALRITLRLAPELLFRWLILPPSDLFCYYLYYLFGTQLCSAPEALPGHGDVTQMSYLIHPYLLFSNRHAPPTSLFGGSVSCHGCGLVSLPLISTYSPTLGRTSFLFRILVSPSSTCSNLVSRPLPILVGRYRILVETL